ncbi:MAG: hypothetical protein GXY58_11295 [Planctomycetaceae bacterium]|nr:hypothetical protein [Planctomycetaceae bacterium]
MRCSLAVCSVLLLTLLGTLPLTRSAPAQSPQTDDWVQVTEDDRTIKVTTGKLEAVIPKKEPKHWPMRTTYP